MTTAEKGGDKPEKTDEQNAEFDEVVEARRKERMQALEDEAAEAEHIDEFLAGGSYDDGF
jgi:hypothetical protein